MQGLVVFLILPSFVSCQFRNDIPYNVVEMIKTMFLREIEDDRCILPFQDGYSQRKVSSQVPTNKWPYSQFLELQPICLNIFYGKVRNNVTLVDISQIKLAIQDIRFNQELYLAFWATNPVSIEISCLKGFAVSVGLSRELTTVTINIDQCGGKDLPAFNIYLKYQSEPTPFEFIAWGPFSSIVGFDKGSYTPSFPDDQFERVTSYVKVYHLSIIIIGVLLMVSMILLPCLFVFYYGRRDPFDANSMIPFYAELGSRGRS
ncbi:unnamed protein product [Bursaphelenchus okinawaensis]|uniref:Uncharacterized protein n=1 Tax=Bursaphelenchus okinawaensis TaxID=465554 RepID=A0A811LIB7_9BILA|nr:unnamed protein product [Bursaphelenchus okinawaensis]CAG9123769.1 unnamed protein product [Bursaphelenchus okinawaensis]